MRGSIQGSTDADFVLPSLPSDDVDMLEAHDIFDGVFAHNITVPSMLEESLFQQHLDSNLTSVVSVPDTVTSSDALIEHRDIPSEEGEFESPLAEFTQSLTVSNDISNDANMISLDLLSLQSFSDSETLSSTDDKEDECRKRLYLWSTRFSISRVAKTELLALLRDVAFPNLPVDWRTLEKRQKIELSLQTNVYSQASMAHDYVVHVCGKCYLYRFKASDLNVVTPCSHCKVSRIHCGLPNCSYACVITESLGQRTMNSLESCHLCLVDSECMCTVRAYGYRVAPFVHRVFGDARASLKLLAPFTDFFSYHPDTSTFTTSSDWYTKWVSKMMTMTFKSEIFHGKQFFNHTIWRTGIRSVVLALSIDWFPPFKSQEYSIGVVSVIPANLSVTERADVSNLWPVLIIEGPKEPLHTLFLLEELCTELNNLEEVGIAVADSLTNESIRVHVTLGPVIADTPANAKIGDHAAHSGYFACIICRYRGALCGCKSKAGENLPAKFDNYFYGGGPRALISGSHRSKRKGEHISWTDSDLILERHIRHDDEHRKNQITVMKKRLSQPFVAAQYDRLRKSLLVNAISPLALIVNFKFTRCFVIESMHVVLKGMLLTQLKLTLDIAHKDKTWCIHHSKGAKKALALRLKCYRFPKGHNQPYRVHERFKRLKCAELLDFVRVCSGNIFHGLISDDAAKCWFEMSQLYCALLHSHVNVQWVQSASGLAELVKTAYQRYESVYSACHMPSNFHRFLHCRIDFNDWGPMRSHWAFPFERLYQAVMRAASHCN